MVAALGALALGSWHAAPPLHEPRAAHAVVATRSAIYVLGGSSGTTAVERFDGTRWQVVSHLPHGGPNAPAAVALGGRIWVLGGFEQQTNLPAARVEIYDPRTNRWRDGPPLPPPRGGEAAAILDGKIHVLGGGNDRSTLAPAAAVLGGRLYAIGGRSGFDDFGDVDVSDAAHDRWAHGRRSRRAAPPARPPTAARSLFGGESQATSSALGDVFRLTRGANAWRHVSQLPTARNDARTVVFHGSIYVVGGSTSAGAGHSAAGSRRVDLFMPYPGGTGPTRAAFYEDEGQISRVPRGLLAHVGIRRRHGVARRGLPRGQRLRARDDRSDLGAVPARVERLLRPHRAARRRGRAPRAAARVAGASSRRRS